MPSVSPASTTAPSPHLGAIALALAFTVVQLRVFGFALEQLFPLALMLGSFEQYMLFLTVWTAISAVIPSVLAIVALVLSVLAIIRKERPRIPIALSILIVCVHFVSYLIIPNFY